MFVKGRVKPSKGASLLGMIVGFGFVIYGVTILLPSNAGFFGLFWVLVALGITVVNGINFFTDRGVSQWEVDVQSTPQSAAATNEDIETKLRMLERLRQDKLITEEEFHKKRSEIIDSKW